MERDYQRRFLAQHNIVLPPVAQSSSSTGTNLPPMRSPQTTPTKCGGDRYMPSRLPSAAWAMRFDALESERPDNTLAETPPQARNGPNTGGGRSNNTNQPASTVIGADDGAKQEKLAHRAILMNELLDAQIDHIRGDTCAFRGKVAGSSGSSTMANGSPSSLLPSPGLFRYQPQRSPIKMGDATTSSSSPYSLSPLSMNSQRLLRSPRKPARKIPKNPYKVLDAPELQDDFYLNLIDWSSRNMLSVGLGSCVYLWSAFNSQVVKLCDLAVENDAITSVQWCEKGELLAVGTLKGLVQIWDVASTKRLRNISGHSTRVGCLAWNGDLICSGSRDRFIWQRDVRTPCVVPDRKLGAHKQEVCGLKWSPDRQYLASGGNDNQLLIWNLRSSQPVQYYNDHNAAVKALAWSPHHHGLLVSGGGTADRHMRFWNTLTGQAMQSVDTGSQVCNIAWSQHTSELVSTHGYSRNQIVIWKYPTLQQVATLTGHTYRVLYLAMSPDGESIVTGAGDETLRFWNVFQKQRSHRELRSVLNLSTSLR